MAVKGVATFSGLTIDEAGSITWLTADAAGRAPVDSSEFNVVAGTAASARRHYVTAG